MLSKKTQYAFRALTHLVENYNKGPVLISEISRKKKIPLKFLENILLELKKEGILESKKGKGGGYALLFPPDQITLGRVIRLMEGPLAPLPCASETAYRKCDECVDDRFCGTRMVMREVRNAMATILDQTTLAQVCARMDEARQSAQDGDELMFYI